MSRPNRPFAMLAVGQAVCLAFGVWALARFASAAGVAVFVGVFAAQAVATWFAVSRMARPPAPPADEMRDPADPADPADGTAEQFVRTRDAVIFGLARVAESRSRCDGHHLERIALYSTRLATALRQHPRYAGAITPEFVRLIGIGSALHDIGNVGIDDAILKKPGRLTDEERFRMQVHAELGGECILEIERRLGSSQFLGMAREIALSHHERWDGAGYPAGLAGEDIPLAARIVAVADVYDALSSERVYKSAYPHEKCVDIIRREAGRQFDPDLVEVFLSIEEQFREVAVRFAEDASEEALTPLLPEIEACRLTPTQEAALILALDECDTSPRRPVAQRS